MKKTLVTFVGALLGFGMLPMLMGPSGGYPTIATFQQITVNGLINNVNGSINGGPAIHSVTGDRALILNSAATNSDISVMCANGQASGSRCWGYRLGGVNDWILGAASDAGVVTTSILDITRTGAAVLNSNPSGSYAFSIVDSDVSGAARGLKVGAGSTAADFPFVVTNVGGAANLFTIQGDGTASFHGDAASVNNGAVSIGSTSATASNFSENTNGTNGYAGVTLNSSGFEALCIVVAAPSSSGAPCSTPAGHTRIADVANHEIELNSGGGVSVNGHDTTMMFFEIDGTATTCPLNTSRDNAGVSSCARNSLGAYTVTTTKTYGANTTPVCTANAGGSVSQIANAFFNTTNTISVHLFTPPTTSVDGTVWVVCMGGS